MHDAVFREWRHCSWGQAKGVLNQEEVDRGRTVDVDPLPLGPFHIVKLDEDLQKKRKLIKVYAKSSLYAESYRAQGLLESMGS